MIVDFIFFLVFIVLGYCIGSISFARIVSTYYGVDITKVGSKNPGATNVNRTLGRKAGILVFFGDFFKSFVIVLIALHFKFLSKNSSESLAIFTLLAAICGHSFPVFFKFKGGKGISVTMGGLAVLMPNSLLIGMLVWFVIFHATRFVSLASLFFAFSLPITSFAFGCSEIKILFSVFIALMIFWRHKDNICRLYHGSEYKFVKKH